ncbi:MAG: MobC family plasmid mobilization relaxosome protein [Methylococcaceae bacterium]|nr:MobC family plasmid mobilization relaxosome protein [Methylococcaceae bacterium]
MDKNNTPQRKRYPPPFSMRFTKDERKKLDLAADGRPLAAYIRWLIFQDRIPKDRTRSKKPVKDHKELAKLLGILGQSRIANNINQLAKAANSGSLPVNEDVRKALMEAATSVKWMRKSLIRAMGLKAEGQDQGSGYDP